MTVGDGDALLGGEGTGGLSAVRRALGPPAAPWPNAAQRAAARRAAEEARRAAEEAELVEQAAAAPLTARPRIEDDTALLGLTRRSHSRWGQRIFTLFFVFVFAVIAVQLLVALLDG